MSPRLSRNFSPDSGLRSGSGCATLGAWNPQPVYGCVFGSAARGDGGSDSDVDVLLVHPPFPGDADPRRRSSGLSTQLAGYASELTSFQLTPRQTGKWR